MLSLSLLPAPAIADSLTFDEINDFADWVWEKVEEALTEEQFDAVSVDDVSRLQIACLSQRFGYDPETIYKEVGDDCLDIYFVGGYIEQDMKDGGNSRGKRPEEVKSYDELMSESDELLAELEAALA